LADKNRQWVLSARPKEMVERENFEWREEPVPSIGDGEFLVRNLWLSCDPAQRAWMEIDTYIPVLPLGEMMLSGSAGESKHPDFAEGDLVTGAFGWQEYAVSDGGSGFFAVTKIPPGVDLPTALSLFGISGLTAYVGLLDIGQPKPGETVLVSGAAGSVGSLVAQIAKVKDCRVPRHHARLPGLRPSGSQDACRPYWRVATRLARSRTHAEPRPRSKK
jgi:NADPH-dependent curcumin reductase CurA